MARFDGDVSFCIQLDGPNIIFVVYAKDHPSDVICATWMPHLQALEFSQAIADQCITASIREGIEVGGKAHRSATVVLPTLDSRVSIDRQSPKILYRLSAAGKT